MAHSAWRVALTFILFTTAVAQCTPCFDDSGNAAGTSAFPAASCGVVSACGLSDGLYWLSPAGTPYQAQCTGGWTLAMQIDGAQQTFAYSSSYWTNGNLLNTAPTSVWQEQKLQTFVDMPGSLLRVVMCSTDNTNCGSPLVLSVGAFPSLQSLFNGGQITTNVDRNTWFALPPVSPSTQGSCNLQGINLYTPPQGGYPSNYARLGLMMNNEGDCGSCDTFIGLGADVWYGSYRGTRAGMCNYPQHASLWVGAGSNPAPCSSTSSPTPTVPSPLATSSTTGSPSTGGLYGF